MQPHSIKLLHRVTTSGVIGIGHLQNPIRRNAAYQEAKMETLKDVKSFGNVVNNFKVDFAYEDSKIKVADKTFEVLNRSGKRSCDSQNVEEVCTCRNCWSKYCQVSAKR